MSYGSTTFTFEELYIWGDPSEATDDSEPHTLNVEVDLECTDMGEAPAAASLNYPGDPGSPPEWEITEVRIINPSMKDIKLDETQFITLHPDAQDIVNNAYEHASEQDLDDYHDY